MGRSRQTANLVSNDNILVDIANNRVGISSTTPNSKLEIAGNVKVSGIITATSFVGDGSGLTGAGSTVADDTTTNATFYPLFTQTTTGTVTASKVSTTKLSFNPSTGSLSATAFSGSGASLTALNASNLDSGIVPAARITNTSALNVGGDLYVAGNISFGGTTTQLNTTQVTFSDPDIVLGVGTTSTFNPTDNTANHGGIAIASTEGSPLVNLNIDPAEILPTTYKKFMWFKTNAAGLGTDSWLSNYAVGIGSTQFPTGTRFAAGNIQLDANDVKVVRNISASGVITATSFVGNGSGLTGAGSTVADDTTTNATFYPLFTQTTTGTVTASKVSTTKLSFNPSTGGLSVTSLSGSLANTLTLNTSGTGLSGSTTYNNSGAATFTVTSNATSANTGSTIVARDGSGNFSAGTITAALSGNSSTATTLQTARTINGISFNGSADIVVNPSSGAYSNGYGTRTVSTSAATGGSDGDIWYQY